MMIEGSGSESIPLASGSGFGGTKHVDPVDPDPDSDPDQQHWLKVQTMFGNLTRHSSFSKYKIAIIT
jgi:hypothetical protein